MSLKIRPKKILASLRQLKKSLKLEQKEGWIFLSKTYSTPFV